MYALMDDVGYGPLVDDVDVVGLRPVDVAAVAARATACDPGSGPTSMDD